MISISSYMKDVGQAFLVNPGKLIGPVQYSNHSFYDRQKIWPVVTKKKRKK